MNVKTREQLEHAYLVVFDGFSASRSDVADALGVSKSVATSRLNKLRDGGLVATVDVNEESQGSARSGSFKEVEWQANETCDSINREEAIAKFAAAFPVKPEPKGSKANGKAPAKPKAAKPAPKPSEVAKLRRGGATWQQTRDHFGVKTPSGGFTKALREAGYGPDGLKLDRSGPRESKARVAPRNRTA